MRAEILPAAITIASLFGSTLMAAAQTGEFAVQVPGPVVHDAWEIQDRLQDARSGKRVNRAAQTDGNSHLAKPRSAKIKNQGLSGVNE
jgi:hypothetical protein